MSNFLSLALDPFSQIISYISYEDITALWICGNRTMQWRLSKGKAVRMIDINPELRKVVEWPSLAPLFSGLEKFRYFDPLYKGKSPLRSLRMASLSQNVKNLEIYSPPDVKAVIEFLKSSPGHFHHLEALTLHCIPKTFDLKTALPQTLRFLSLGDYVNSLDPLDISDLPSNLTRLIVCATSMNTLHYGVEVRFPETLQSLDIVLGSPAEFLHLLPPGLEHLFYSGAHLIHAVDMDWKKMQRFYGLKHLNFNFPCAFSAEDALWLPLTLETFAIIWAVAEYIPERINPILEVFKRLKNLKTLGGFFQPIISEPVAKSLPKTLNDIGVYRVETKAVGWMPPNIQKIEIWKATQISTIDEISGFPTHLLILSIPHINERLASLLPNSLTQLTIEKLEMRISERTIQALPRKLIHLRVNSADEPCIEDMNHLKSLPPNLEICLFRLMRFSNCHISTGPSSSQGLPRYLTQWKIFALADLIPDWFDYLPRSLVSLELDCRSISSSLLIPLASLKNLETCHIHTEKTPNDKWYHCLENVPPKLTSLTIRDWAPGVQTELTNASLRSLPQSLVFILLPASPKLNGECVALLPPKLKSFYFDSFISPNWFKNPM